MSSKDIVVQCAPTLVVFLLSFASWAASATILGSNGLNWGEERKIGLKWGVEVEKAGRTRQANREIEQLTSPKEKYE